jgi:hypothetical protein
MPQQFMQMPGYMPTGMQSGDPAQYQQSPFGYFPMMPQVNPQYPAAQNPNAGFKNEEK